MIAETVRFTMTREITAPRERVFRAWMEGGDWCRPARLHYREIAGPRRLVVAVAAAGADPEDPAAPLAAVVFADRGERTELTLAASAPEDEADDLEETWSLMLDRLAGAVG